MRSCAQGESSITNFQWAGQVAFIQLCLYKKKCLASNIFFVFKVRNKQTETPTGATQQELVLNVYLFLTCLFLKGSNGQEEILYKRTVVCCTLT